MIDFPDRHHQEGRRPGVAKLPSLRLYMYEPEQGVDPKSDTCVSLWISYPQLTPQMFAGDKDNETSAAGIPTMHHPYFDVHRSTCIYS